MEFIDLKSQYIRLKDRIDSRVKAVLDHGQFIMGPEIFELETKLQNYIGTRHCISVGNGTDALTISLRALGIGPGDYVICPSFTFFATAEAVALVGATPIFADSDRSTFNICCRTLSTLVPHLKNRYGDALKGIVAVDLFGLPADYQLLEVLCEEYELSLICDAAQSLGSSIAGKKSASFGTVATTSFFPAKPLGCYGDGGAIFTDCDELADLCRSIRVHGKGADKYENVRIGTNSRLDTIQAAILLEKLEILDDEISQRQGLANTYREALVGGRYDVQCVPDNAQSAWAQFSLLSSAADREEILERLSESGIPFQIYYRTPLHLQRAFISHGYKFGDLPVCESLSQQIFSIPMSPYLSEANVERVVRTLTGL